MKTEPISIRKNGGSLYLRIPPELIRAHELKPGDYIVLKELTVIKAARVVGLGEKVMLEAS